MQKSFCEFFAGIGLVHEALQAGDWECAYANDISEKKAAMYRGRFGESPYYHVGDVWETQDVVDAIPGEPLLATASFPCTDMSLAGRMKGFAGKESSAFFGFAQAIDALAGRRPKLLLLENVVGFLNSNQGADYLAAADTLASLGYWVDSIILDAKDFVPQSRPRLFLFGFHESLEGELVRRTDAAFGDPWLRCIESSGRLRSGRLTGLMRSKELETGWATLPLSAPVRGECSLSGFIDTDDKQAWWDDAMRDKHLNMMSPAHREEVERWRADRQVHVATVFRRIRQGQQRAEVRLDGLAGCLRTPRGGSARQIVVAAGKGEVRIRWMSPREYARLQGAPDFPLAESDSQSLFGFGDAVCTPVIRWIDEQILTPLVAASPHCSVG